MSDAATSTTSLDAGTRLAIDRTRLAYERTLMAWVRTSVSLISFGFTIYKFFQFELGDRAPVPGQLVGPREFALALITVGLASLLLATIEHRHTMRDLRARYGDIIPRSTATLVGGLFSVVGLVTLVVVLLRR
jgi:putative membrane protein